MTKVLRSLMCLVALGSFASSGSAADFLPPLPGAPQITSVDLDGEHLFIAGKNFGTSKAPEVTLGGGILPVASYSPTVIVATVSATFAPGSYPLYVRSFATRLGLGLYASLDVTLGGAGGTGPMGPTGPTGPAGPAGPRGATGLMGPEGAAGATGPIGPQGVAGPQGSPGPAGPMGVPGSPGVDGKEGAPGPAGPRGLQGLAGAQGPAGPAGPQGAAGGPIPPGAFVLARTCPTGWAPIADQPPSLAPLQVCEPVATVDPRFAIVQCRTGADCASGRCYDVPGGLCRATVGGCPSGLVPSQDPSLPGNLVCLRPCEFDTDCSFGQTCVLTECRPTSVCPAPYVVGPTFNCQRPPCGAGGACPAPLTCEPSTGSCVEPCAGGPCPTCAAGLSSCNGACVDWLTDAGNCGGCGNVCSSGRACNSGSCACPTGMASCGELGCADITSDPWNCGACGNSCSEAQACVEGACVQVGCPAPLTDCGGSCRALATDPLHCGACGNACGPGFTCQEGTCQANTTCGGPEDCPGTDTGCQLRDCFFGTCGISNLPAGQPAFGPGVDDPVGDCHSVVCDGSGGMLTVVDDLDVPPAPNLCVVPTCQAGTPSQEFVPAFTQCSYDAGLWCDGAGNCVQH